MRRLLLGLGLLTCAPVATAQDWQHGVTNNGQWFEGWLVAPDEAMLIWCGGPTIGGPGLPQTDEPMLTDPGTFDLALRLPSLDPADPTIFTGARTDLMIVAAGQGFGLPGAHWDELNGMGWTQRLGVSDPLFAALAQEGEVQVWAGGAFVAALPGRGLAEGLSVIGSSCRAGWGEAPPPPATPAGAPPLALVAAAQANVTRGCNGPAAMGPAALSAGDLDGDRAPDLVLDWAGVTCQTGVPRPFCGAANCTIEVFLSSRPDRVPFDAILGAGSGLESGAGGTARLTTGVTSAGCPRATRPDRCRMVWQVTRDGLSALPPGGG
jgi:hypothetical protein